jgi:hypothetical protein
MAGRPHGPGQEMFLIVKLTAVLKARENHLLEDIVSRVDISDDRSRHSRNSQALAEKHLHDLIRFHGHRTHPLFITRSA